MIISAIFCDHMETDRIVFVPILQLGDLLPASGGGSHIKVRSNFERKPVKYQDLILWAWLNSLSLPTGTFLKRHVTAVIFVSGLINTLKGARVALIRAAILDLITFSRTKSLILTPKI